MEIRTLAEAAVHSPSLKERYLTYRRAQGRELLNVVPREGVRSLLRHFHSAEGLDGRGPVPEGDGALQWLAERCSTLLPLPPFEEWVLDFHRAREAYALIPGPPLAPEAPGGEAVTVDVRTLLRGREEWVAALALRPCGEGRWVGHIRFHPSQAPEVFTTGEVFREATPVEVRRRFRDFDDRTLNAFLSSALP